MPTGKDTLPAAPAREDADDLRRQLTRLRERNLALENEVVRQRESEVVQRAAERGRAAAVDSRTQLLLQASAMLSDSLDYVATLRQVATLAVPALADWCTVAVVDHEGVMKRVAVVHKDPALQAVAQEYERTHPPSQHRQSGFTQATQTRTPTLFEQVTDETLRAGAQDEAHLQLLRTLGCASCILAPMLVRGEVVGVLSFMLSDTARRFERDEVAIAEELARRAAVTVDNARLYHVAKEREAGKRRQAEQRYELLIDSIRDYAVFMLTPEGYVATWNPGANRIKGYLADEIIGKHFSVFYPETDVLAGKCEYELAEAAKTGRFEDLGWRKRKDGSPFWASVIISAIRDEVGDLVGFSKVTRDMTEWKRAEEAQEARLVAEQASRAKDEFLAMLGHELRNPLAPIVTALQLMKLRNSDTKSSREQQIIERQVQHMVRLVDDLLDVSRITKGKIELKRQHLDLSGVVAKSVEIASPLLEQRRHHFNVVVPPQPIFVDGDEARLAQVFANLLTNAAKYTEPGGHIEVVVRADGGDAIVEVSDDGVGIAPDLLPRIFDLFVQGYQSAERSIGGLGIGLSLVRSLVSLHGGEVTASSPGSGRGSTFAVRLAVVDQPQQRLSGEASRPLAVASTSARRVLVVDDNEDALELVSEVLRTFGHDVRTAADGAAALHMVRHFKPEVAILDIGLPVMDGYELAERIRSELGDGAPRLIALTGYGQPTDRVRSRQAGFASHLVKPIDAALLRQEIEAPLQKSGPLTA